jgi:hypothetical protein
VETVLEPIAGRPTHDSLGVTHVAVGVKNNGTKTFRRVHLKCGIYYGSDLVGAGDAYVNWLYPGQKGYGLVQTFDEGAFKGDKADCHVEGVMFEDEDVKKDKWYAPR